MEQRAADVQVRLSTIRTFGDLVNAMRGVAAARTQRSRALIDGVNAYVQTVAGAMAQVEALGPAAAPAADRAAGGRPLWLVFCAEQGFSGGFSEAVLDAAADAHGDRVFLLGAHGLRLGRARGIRPEGSAPLISHADGAVAASERLHTALVEALAARSAPSVEMVHAELTEANRYAIRRHRLLPLDPRPAGAAATGALPWIHLPPDRLREELTVEYIAARLMQALLHSHAAENLARLEAMAAAHENVAHMEQALEADDRRLRQEAITAEIVELAAALRVRAFG